MGNGRAANRIVDGVGATLMVLTWIAVVGGGLVGWVWNIIKLVDMDSAQHMGMLVARIIGIFMAPLGAVLGYF